jgi:putative transposase
MWIDVKTLSNALGKTPRAVQIAIKKDPSIQTRPKNKKSVEINVASLPADWRTAVAKAGMDVNQQALATLAPATQLATQPQKGKPVAVGIGSKLTDAQKQRLAISAKLKSRPIGTPLTIWVASIARMYGVSTSTVRRIGKEVEQYGPAGRPLQRGRMINWDGDAVAYLKGFYLSALRQAGACPKTYAWRHCQEEAKRRGWKVGGRSSAYALMAEIDKPLVQLAIGGRRALDNYLYISRDPDSLHPFQIVIGDQHIFDFWVADYTEGRIWRPECYLWLDMHTKLVYGISFTRSHYDADTVKEAFRFGLYRWGRPDCTYNDNGSSECAKATKLMIDDLLRYGIQEKDISDLYRTPDGRYVVTDKQDDKVVDIANTPEEWRTKHRRIYANVRNAKAKDIERFFRTAESMLSGRLLPGRCKTPGAPVAIDELERKRLEDQKAHQELLTYEQFVHVVVDVINEYETQIKHSTLHMTPMAKLEKDIKELGFDMGSRRIPALDIELLTADRKRCTVRRGRVLVDGIWYEGEPISANGTTLNDTGLWRFDEQRVEVRYTSHDRGFCYALVTSRDSGQMEPRQLHPVKKIPMLDHDAMVEALKWKNTQIRAVVEVFDAVTRDIGSVMYEPQPMQETKQAERVDMEEEPKRKLAIPFLPMHPTKEARYQWCLDMLIAGQSLTEKDKAFCRDYRQSDDYQDYGSYWSRYEQQINAFEEAIR